MPSDDVPPAQPSFADPRRLHPASIALGIPLTQLIQALIFPAAAAVTTGGRITVWLLVGVAAAGIVVRTLAWQRFRYSFDGNVIRVSSGVISRNHRSVDIGRIQQVELDRSLAHRLVGVTTVRIETAGSNSGPEIELRVLTHAEALALRAAVRTSQRLTSGAPGATDPGTKLPTLLTVPLRHVALAAVTGRQLFVLPAILGAGLQLLGGQIGAFFAWTIERIESVVGDSGVIGSGEVTVGLALAVAVAGLLAAAIVTAAAVGIVRDGGFTVQRDGDDLVVHRGLINTRSSSIPLGRVQLVHVARNPLRRLLRVASVRIHSAGGAGGADGRIVVPLVTNARVPSLVTTVLNVDEVPPLSEHPQQARRRALFRWIRRLVPLAILVGFVTHVRQRSEMLEPFDLRPASLIDWLGDLAAGYWASSLPAVAIAVGAALVVALMLGRLEYKLLAHGVGPEVIASRNGTIGSLTVFAPTRRIQAATLRSSWFQRRLRLATVIAHIAGPGGDIQVTDVADSVAVERHSRLVDDASGSHLNHDRDRAIVDQPNLHVGPESSGRDLDTGPANGLDKTLDERFGDLGRRGVDE